MPRAGVGPWFTRRVPISEMNKLRRGRGEVACPLLGSSRADWSGGLSNQAPQSV